MSEATNRHDGPTPGKGAGASGGSHAGPAPGVPAPHAKSTTVTKSPAAAAARVVRKPAIELVVEAEERPVAWRRQLVRQLNSWASSAVVHVAVIVCLALLTLSVPRRDQPSEIVSSLLTRPDELMSQHIEESLAAAESLTFAPSTGATLATHSDALTSAETPELDRAAADALDAPNVMLADVSLYQMPVSELNEALGRESPGEPAAAVDGMGQALDRITQQLLLMLAKDKVLVVWLFDESESMFDDQQRAKQRLDHIYQELRLSNASAEDALLSVVASFGSTMTVHTRRPTTDLDVVRNAIDEIGVDSTGEERTFAAVIEMVKQHRRFAVQGKRQLAIIVVTDESGDDGHLLDTAIAEARAADCSVFVLGYEAAFGYPHAFITWTDPETGYQARLPLDRGPETPAIEQLQTNGLWRRHDWHSSGFGPYELVRLCRETGGIYFILPDAESNLVGAEGMRKYQFDAMRPYLPDLGSREDYLRQRQASELRTALWEVITSLNPKEDSQVELREYFVLEPSTFVSEVARQLPKARHKIAMFEAAEKRLAALAHAREQEPLLRWQANYDLIYAQVVAYQARVYEYAAYLEAFVQNPKAITDPKTNRWKIVPQQRLIAGEVTQAKCDQATALLQRVIDLHPNTPFAARAQWELRRGYGVEFIEHHHPPDYDKVKWPKL